MSLPPSFSTPEEYFRESLKFFQKFQPLVNFPNTEILVRNILGKMNIDNLEDLDVFQSDFNLESQIENNNSLKYFANFFGELQRLRVFYEDVNVDEDLVSSVVDVDEPLCPMCPKKKHEIVLLTQQLKEVCEENGCEIVVDFGAGLGYLDQLIYEKSSLKVLGIECNENFYVAAKIRQRKYYSDSIEKVKYVKHTISENSNRNIEEYLIDKFGKSNNFCMTGLHACADLTIDGIRLFLKMAEAKALILMPCCYHKMASENGRFKNFPLSNCLKEIFEEIQGWRFIKVPFLRLAAQPPFRHGDTLEDLVFNLLSRATLQLYAHKHNCKLKRNKRKAVRTKTVHNNFAEYLQHAVVGFTMTRENQPSNHADTDESTETNFDLEEIENLWRETENLKLKAAIFIILQNYLQPVVENFVLYDRLVYLKESGIKHCYFKKVFNEKVSPRCLALLSIK